MSSKEQFVHQALLCDLALSVLQEQFPIQHGNAEQNNSMDVPDHDAQAYKESMLALTDDEEEANNYPFTVF